MKFNKFLSVVIVTFSTISNYSSAMSLTIDVLDKDKYKVSVSSDSYDRSETFYGFEEFPEKLNTLTCGSVNVDSVYFEDEVNNLIRFEGIKQNDDKIVKFTINSANNLETRVVLDFGNNIVNFPNISWNDNITMLDVMSSLKFDIKYRDSDGIERKRFKKTSNVIIRTGYLPRVQKPFSFVTFE